MLQDGSSRLVGNAAYRKFLRPEKDAISINMETVADEARYDGEFVLRTNTRLPAADVALQYKRLLPVEQFFQAAKTMLQSRPIFHQRDAPSKGHGASGGNRQSAPGRRCGGAVTGETNKPVVPKTENYLKIAS